ncbi:MAG: VWA domain-containing protein [Deltaproteobacteria bacterium]|nr:VWA domain-containing protein [Deltaproteobacteria bacterium]
MSGIGFEHVELLWLLWLLVPFGALVWLAARRRRSALERFADPEMLERLAPPLTSGRSALRVGLLGFAFVWLIVALAGPTWGFHWEDVRRRGVDLVVALDLSRSMLAEDSKPDRLTAAKREIRDLIDLLRGDRVGLVAFAGTAFVQCPLTLDYHAFELFLDKMDPNWVPVGGTDLAAAVRVSMEAFPENERSGKAVLLITDGEDHSGELQAAAEEARQQGVHVFVVGIGNREGAPIPDGRGGFVKQNGKVVLSKLDEPALKELALTTDGTYVQSVAGDLDLRTIYLDDIKGTLEARELSSSRQRREEERFQWALLPAILLLLLEGLTGAGRSRGAARVLRQGSSTATVILSTMLLGLLMTPAPALAWSLFGSESPVELGHEAYEKKDWQGAYDHWSEAQQANPNDRRLDYNVAQALYNLEDYPGAESQFLAATATDATALAADAFYGAGNAAFQQGRYPDAISHFEACLKLRPEDEDAEHNRDLAQRRYEELMEQAQQQQENSDQQEPPPEDGQTDEQEQGEEDQQGESEQQQQDQQQGQAGEQDEQAQDGQAENDGENPEEQEPSDGSEGQQEQENQEQQEQQEGGAAEAADIDRSSEAGDDTPADGAVSSSTEEAEGDDRPRAVVEGALTEEQAEQLLKALEADQSNRREERTEREAKRGRRAAGKDW